ncbi:MAG: DUF4142 domain-containing protein [Bryobacteraceae bacterium]
MKVYCGASIVTLATIILAVPLCRAQKPEKSGIVFDQGAGKMMQSRDVAFALNAAQVLAGEEQLAALAIKQAGPAVKQFAERLSAENRKIARDLRDTAAKMQLTLPKNATQQDLSQRGDLLKRSGLKFDAVFANNLVTDSREDLASFQKEAKKGKNPEMKSFAARALPVLRARFDTVKALRAKLKSAGA